MNKSHITAILSITSLAFSTGAVAQNMLKNEYNTAAKNINTEHGFGKANYASYADNCREPCVYKTMKRCGE